MKIINIFLILLSFTSCKSPSQKAYLKAKADHEKRMETIKTLPEPFENKVADSMKKWIPVFKNVYASDQKHRLIGYGFTEEGLKEQIAIDSQNLIIITSFLDKYGWPAALEMGLIAQLAVGMTIQHAPLKIQEKYYPYLVNAYKRDTLLFETVALLEDRINMRNKRLQFYGTQLVSYKGKQVLFPVFEVDSLEVRRKRIGFDMPVKEYMKLLKSEWNIDEYKQILPGLIKDFKVSDSLGFHHKL